MKSNPQTKLHIAIDGANASGKDTVGSILAYQLDCFFIESGSIYRAAARYVLDAGIKLADIMQVNNAIRHCRFTVHNTSSNGRIVPSVFVNNEDLTSLLHTSEIDLASSVLAGQHKTRQILIDMKKQMAKSYRRLIMTGRGIGNMVLPDADLKIYLNATAQVRARRRFAQRRFLDPHITLEQIAGEIRHRDKMNQERIFDPDIPAPDSIIIDTSQLDIQGVCDKIISLIPTRSTNLSVI